MTNEKDGKQCSIKNGNYFENPWNKWPFNLITGPIKFANWYLSLFRKSFKPIEDKELEVYKPYWISSNKDGTFGDLKATWLGHASVLVEIDGFTVLCDPVFSEQCPYLVGPKRYRACPVDLQCKDFQNKKLDAVVISHNHFDHMDSETLKNLIEQFEDAKFIVPLGDGANIKRFHNAKHNPEIIEMNWWQEHYLEKGDNKLKIVFTPTQHWSKRGVWDSFKSLWGSYCFIGNKHKFWFGGDTGYCPAFKQIGANFGPFDGAAIPIGAYEPRELMTFQHVNPSEAVQIHKDIKSKASFGIHWGTFTLTEEQHLQPREDLEKIVKSADEPINFVTCHHGQTMIFHDDCSIEVIQGDLLKPQGSDNRTRKNSNCTTGDKNRSNISREPVTSNRVSAVCTEENKDQDNMMRDK